MNQEREGLTVREMAKELDLRLGTCYGLLWDETIAATKSETGEWIVDRQSVEAYRLRRRRSLQGGAIE